MTKSEEKSALAFLVSIRIVIRISFVIGYFVIRQLQQA